MDADVPEALRDLLWRVHDVEAALAGRLRVGVSDVQALQVLVTGATGTVGLGRALRMRSASAAALVDRLQAAGHVRRVPHPTDRRRVVLQITDSGREQVLAALQPLLGAVDTITAELTAADRVVVARFLRRTSAELQRFADSGR